jgi:hypothetical protein
LLDGAALSLHKASGVMWNDIGMQTRLSERGPDAAVISSQDLHRYAQAAGSEDRKIKGFVFGHAHAFQEFCVMGTTRFRKKKVLATTLGCVWAKGPSLDNVSGQGLLIRVAPKVSRWTKQLIVLEGRGLDTRARAAPGEVGMYVPFYSSR